MVDNIRFQEFEKEVMSKLLDGTDETLDILRKQYNSAKIIKREFSGVGFFTTFKVPDSAPKLKVHKSFQICDVIGQIDGVKYGVGFVLFIKDGVLDFLEGYTYGDEDWPETILNYQLSYMSGNQRDMIKFCKIKKEGS